jgi:hypothetical protein
MVLAADTKTGKDQSEAVTAVLVHHDTDLYNLTVKTSTGTEVIHTTSSHLFWDPSLDKWVSANKLSKGEHLKTPNGTTAVADGGTTPTVRDGWMWDLTVPGNNDHDFYVSPASGDVAASILVHNVGGVCPTNGSRISVNDALDTAEQYLGEGYQESVPGSGRYVSSDGTRAVRMGESDITGAHGGGPHMNFEELAPNPMKPGKMMVVVNSHVYLIDP